MKFLVACNITSAPFVILESFENKLLNFQALDLEQGNVIALVARSKCYLHIGDAQAALQDAESSLKNNENYHRVSNKLNLIYKILMLFFVDIPLCYQFYSTCIFNAM